MSGIRLGEVPKMKIILLSLILGLIVTIPITTIVDLGAQDQGDITNNDTTRSDQPPSSNTNSSKLIQETKTQSTKIESSLDGSTSTNQLWKPILLFFLFWILVSSISYVGTSNLYQSYYNSIPLINYINKHLRYHDFNTSISRIGKTFVIGKQVKMEIGEEIIKFQLPMKPHYTFYGFVKQGEFVSTSVSLDRLPLKLRSIRLYLEED